MIPLPSILDVSNLRGVRVLLRLDLNVPLEHGEIRDPYRITEALPTLEYLRSKGARTIIVSHIGKGAPTDTLRPVADYLGTLMPVSFLSDVDSPKNEALSHDMKDGDVLMLENIRHHRGEEANDDACVSMLARLGDIYVNDAFSVSHRTHASVVGLPKVLPHYAGLRLMKEVDQLSLAFQPERPFLFILGGAKISTKMPLLHKFLSLADHVLVGGATVNNLFRAKGLSIGKSVYDASVETGLDEILANPRLIMPIDVVVKNDSGSEIRSVSEVTSGDTIVDVGPDTISHMEHIIGKAALIVWNGPLGFYEEGFTEGTKELLDRISGSRATSVIGGGDTVALIGEMGGVDRFSFVSTGGGAMLDYLAHETLPGIDALRA
jgi:phosphoglycerate kinase